MSLAFSSSWGEGGRPSAFFGRRTSFLLKSARRTKYGLIHMSMVDVEFEWDLRKDAANVAKHGCSFVEAEQTFRDPNGLMFSDDDHSQIEQRFYWVGASDAGRILTTRFTHRGSKVRIIGCAEWRKFRRLYEAAKAK